MAKPHELPFLHEMLYEATYWRESPTRPPLHEGLARPEVKKLLDGWGRTGDTAFFALSNEVPIGAVWYRFWSEEDHGYGFVDPATPELGIAVRSAMRRRGVATTLMYHMLRFALIQNISQLSLAVEPDNPARMFYEHRGFHVIHDTGGSLTMVISLP